MKENSAPFKNSIAGKVVFILSLFVSGFWWLVQFVDVYRFAVVGAIFELLWLPSVAMLYGLPVISLILLIKEKLNIRSLYIYSILIAAATIFSKYLGIMV